MSDDGFLSRWSRRKSQALRGEAPPPEEPPPPPAAAVVVAPAVVALPEAPAEPAPPPEPPPSLEDAAQLTPQSLDFSRFVRADVTPEVKHTALKTLFADPHFNVMDGLDVYIDDYGKPDPLPPSMLRQLVQSQLLGLFDAEPEPPPATPTATPAASMTAAPEPPAVPPPHEDPDLRLQPDDAAGRAEPPAGAGEDAGREP